MQHSEKQYSRNKGGLSNAKEIFPRGRFLKKGSLETSYVSKRRSLVEIQQRYESACLFERKR